MFNWGKKVREEEEQFDREQLQMPSEKELLIEVMIELKRIDKKLDRVRRTVISHSD